MSTKKLNLGSAAASNVIYRGGRAECPRPSPRLFYVGLRASEVPWSLSSDRLIRQKIQRIIIRAPRAAASRGAEARFAALPVAETSKTNPITALHPCQQLFSTLQQLFQALDGGFEAMHGTVTAPPVCASHEPPPPTLPCCTCPLHLALQLVSEYALK